MNLCFDGTANCIKRKVVDSASMQAARNNVNKFVDWSVVSTNQLILGANTLAGRRRRRAPRVNQRQPSIYSDVSMHAPAHPRCRRRRLSLALPLSVCVYVSAVRGENRHCVDHTPSKATWAQIFICILITAMRQK